MRVGTAEIVVLKTLEVLSTWGFGLGLSRNQVRIY